jgi:DNA-binding MarR family transcriptional regulator
MNARNMDELLGTNGRLAIVATLAQVEALSFTELGRETGLADGNLHVQTRKLLAAEYLTTLPGQKGKRKVTRFSLTDLGREKFQSHVSSLAAAAGGFLESGGRSARSRRHGPGSGPRGKDDSQVW